MESIQLKGFVLAGLNLGHTTENSEGQSNKDCGNLWQRFESEGVASQIPDKIDSSIFAVYYNYEGDYTKPFSYFIGCKIDPDTIVPETMSRLEIPPQTYLKCEAKGQMPDCISNLWKEIWSSSIPRLYGFDLEIYDDRSHNWEDAVVEVYLSVKEQ